MPELPDVTVYVERLEDRLAGRALQRLRLLNPFVLRSVAPPLDAVAGRKVKGVRRMGKRIVFELEGALFLVLHLMIAGRPAGSPRTRNLRGAYRLPLSNSRTER